MLANICFRRELLLAKITLLPVKIQKGVKRMTFSGKQGCLVHSPFSFSRAGIASALSLTASVRPVDVLADTSSLPIFVQGKDDDGSQEDSQKKTS